MRPNFLIRHLLTVSFTLTLALALPLLALLLGAALDRITDPHRVDLLSAPLLLIIAWHVLVYLGLLIWLCIPSHSLGWPGASVFG